MQCNPLVMIKEGKFSRFSTEQIKARLNNVGCKTFLQWSLSVASSFAADEQPHS